MKFTERTRFSGAGRHIDVLRFVPVERQEMKLPRLPAIEHAQAIGLHFLIVQIDHAGDAQVLFDPGVFDRLGADPKESLGQVPERAVRKLLNLKDVLHLIFSEHALFDQQLTNLDSAQNRPPSTNLKLISVSAQSG